MKFLIAVWVVEEQFVYLWSEEAIYEQILCPSCVCNSQAKKKVVIGREKVWHCDDCEVISCICLIQKMLSTVCKFLVACVEIAVPLGLKKLRYCQAFNLENVKYKKYKLLDVC